MLVTFDGAFRDGILDLSKASDRLAAAQHQISSGRRIGAPSDDPAGTSAAIGARATMTRLDAYTRATDAGSSRLTIADSALTDIVNQLTAAKTTALGARGSTQTAAERAAASASLLSIRDALLSDINTKVQGTYLFGGTNATAAAFVDAGGVATYQGTSLATAIDIGLGRTVDVTFDGSQIYQGTDPQNILDALTSLASAVSTGDDAGIAQGLDALDGAFGRAVSAQARVGNGLRAIDDLQPQLQAARLDAEARRSQVEDADLAAAAVEMSAADTAYRAALGGFATANRQSLMDYLK